MGKEVFTRFGPRLNGVYKVAISATVATFTIPDALYGKRVLMQALAADGDVLFGGTADTSVATGVASTVMTPNAAQGWKLISNAPPVEFVFPEKQMGITQFSIDGSGAGHVQFFAIDP